MKNTLPSYSRYRNDYETAKALGAAALACNAILIPTGYESLRLLIQNFTRPMVTNNDPADVDYAGGLASHVQGVPKTDFESSITVIETETAALSKFAEAVVANGGMLPECKIVFGSSDGTSMTGGIVYTIYDVAFTFSDGGGEIDASSRSQILTISGSMRYMYFGENSSLGTTGTNALNSISNSLTSPNAVNAVASGVSGLLKIMQSNGLTTANTNTATNGFLMDL